MKKTIATYKYFIQRRNNVFLVCKQFIIMTLIYFIPYTGEIYGYLSPDKT
jgi:hypothetical protein